MDTMTPGEHRAARIDRLKAADAKAVLARVCDFRGDLVDLALDEHAPEPAETSTDVDLEQP